MLVSAEGGCGGTMPNAKLCAALTAARRFPVFLVLGRVPSQFRTGVHVCVEDQAVAGSSAANPRHGVDTFVSDELQLTVYPRAV
jgi:hypothetical protein